MIHQQKVAKEGDHIARFLNGHEHGGNHFKTELRLRDVVIIDWNPQWVIILYEDPKDATRDQVKLLEAENERLRKRQGNVQAVPQA